MRSVPRDAAARAVDLLLILDLPGALGAAHRARREAAAVRAFLRLASRPSLDPAGLVDRAADLLARIEAD